MAFNFLHHVLFHSTHTENCVILDLFHKNRDDLARENGQNVRLATHTAKLCSTTELVKASTSDHIIKIFFFFFFFFFFAAGGGRWVPYLKLGSIQH
jgi:hypothetical protein